MQATILHLFGIDHDRFTCDLQDLPARLTGVEPARVVNEIFAQVSSRGGLSNRGRLVLNLMIAPVL